MTLHQFTHLPDEVQLAFMFRLGTYLARRWDDFHQAVNLYQLPSGFFVEVNYDTDKKEVKHLFAFEAGTEDDRLPNYDMFVKLPDWLPETE